MTPFAMFSREYDKMEQPVENIVAQLQARIEHLEEGRRFIQNALEMVLSMADFNVDFSEADSLDQLLRAASVKIKKILPLQGCAIFLVDDQTAEFVNAYSCPNIASPNLKSQIDFMIEEGFFAWAIRERRGLQIASQDHTQQYLLHVIANTSGVLGMFIGLFEGDRSSVPDTSLTLLSITLFNLANVMENIAHFRRISDQNALLEQKVEERTRKLNESKEELKTAMQHQKQLAIEADQANRAKGQFLANMSHEIRTPLNGIIGCSELMLKAGSEEECKELAKVALNESEHLLNLINNILDYSKVEAGKITLENQPFDLEELLTTITQGLALQADTKNIRLNLRISGEPENRVLGDALRLRQIIINLVNNAIKFTSQGSVTLDVACLNRSEDDTMQTLRFAVVDTGIGIPKERQEAIFKRFTQVDESTTRQYGGTGLGTSIANQLVALMGGELSVESIAGQGSTFAFTIDLALDRCSIEEFPCREDDPATGEADTSHLAGTILVAEDTPVNQLVIRQHLESEGHVVIIVENGKDAVQACCAQHFDLILMDVQMPVMDGLEATRQIKARLKKPQLTPVVALTANTDTRTQNQCHASGMDAVLTKPIRRDPLIRAVNKWLVRGKVDTPPLQKDDPVCFDEFPEEQTPATYPSAPLDMDTLLYEFGDADIVREALGQLLVSVPKYIAEIREAYGIEDYETIRLRAHAIKGGTATLEAGILSASAAALEDLCKRKAFGDLGQAMEAVEGDFEALKEYLDSVQWP